jgi:hypothetical protein
MRKAISARESWDGKRYSRIADYLPNPSLIIEPAKTADMIPVFAI